MNAANAPQPMPPGPKPAPSPPPPPKRQVFISEQGSRVVVRGERILIEWDWLEEGACFDSVPEFNQDPDHPAIIAACSCGHCGGQFHVPLAEVTPPSAEAVP
jgi:hypothetical protein